MGGGLKNRLEKELQRNLTDNEAKNINGQRNDDYSFVYYLEKFRGMPLTNNEKKKISNAAWDRKLEKKGVVNNKRAAVLNKLKNGEKFTKEEAKILNEIWYENKLKEMSEYYKKYPKKMKESIPEKVKEPFTKYIYPPYKEKINKKEPLDETEFISGSDYIKYLYGSTNVYKQSYKNDTSISFKNSEKYYHKDNDWSPAPYRMSEENARIDEAQYGRYSVGKKN